jgi:hypothetical protein
MMKWKGFGRKLSWSNFKTIRRLPGGTEEKHEKPVFGPRFVRGTSQIRNRILNKSASIFDGTWYRILYIYIYIVTYSGFYIHDGTLLHSKSRYTTVKHSRQLLEHTYTSNLYGTGTLIPIGFFQQDLLWQSSNTSSHS